MTTYFIGEIKWVSVEQGGRKTLPLEGHRYCPSIIRETENTWSIDTICPNFKDTNKIVFSMFSSEAPVERIKVAETYELFDGPQKVATVLILCRFTI